MRDCTCVGSCRGASGLGDGWNCVVDNGSVEDKLIKPTNQPERVKRLARGFAAEWLRPDDPDSATSALLDTLQTAMLAFFACASRLTLDSAAPVTQPARETEQGRPRYGCKQCQRDFNHEPVTFSIGGIPARTHFFCSTACRERWNYGDAFDFKSASPAAPVAVPRADASREKLEKLTAKWRESARFLEGLPATQILPSVRQDIARFRHCADEVESALREVSQ